jgi:hypothetical protein
MARKSNGYGESEGAIARGRRWFHLRPEPRRRTDLLGINSTWWMAVAWVLVVLALISPVTWG